MKKSVEVLVLSATPAELECLARDLVIRREECLGGRRLLEGSLADRHVALLVTGVGKTNAGLALGAVLEWWAPSLLLAVGVGGAYAGSGPAVGGVAVATAQFYGDEGVETADGFRSMEETGFALWEGPAGSVFNRFPTDPEATAALLAATKGAGIAGAFVTVSTVTGSAARAASLQRRFEAVCETMEGAAYAHGALSRGIRYTEVRGISNLVGPRDRASWKVGEAAEVCQNVALQFLLGPWKARQSQC